MTKIRVCRSASGHHGNAPGITLLAELNLMVLCTYRAIDGVVRLDPRCGVARRLKATAAAVFVATQKNPLLSASAQTALADAAIIDSRSLFIKEFP